MRTSKQTVDPFEFLFLFENIMKANGIKDFKMNAHHDVAKFWICFWTALFVFTKPLHILVWRSLMQFFLKNLFRMFFLLGFYNIV